MNLLKNLAKSVLSSRLLTTARTRVIFMHHDVSELDAPQHSPLYSTTPPRFREQIDFLSRHFEFVALEALFLNPSPASIKPLVSLTFDDGFLSVKENALPYLSERKIPFAVFVSAQAMKENRLSYGDKYPELNRTYSKKIYLDENDVQELDQKGVVIGNHSKTHRILPECDSKSLDDEVVGNKRYLETLLNKPVRHLAIPYGKAKHYNAEVIAVCRRSSHDFIYSNNPTPFQSGTIKPMTDLIPRIGLTGQDARDIRFLVNRALFKKIDL